MDTRVLVPVFFVAGVLGFFSDPAWFIVSAVFGALYVWHLARYVLS